MKFFDYHKAEALSCRLAQLLAQELGDELRRTGFLGVPRGGTFVLGFLSYFLDLHSDQIYGLKKPTERLVVVVDDCALSGRRGADVLESLPNHQIIFAHLASPPELRAEIQRRNSRVRACFAAYDLRQRTKISNEKRESFQREWHERLGEERYWLGAVEPLAFAWSEPDRQLWNQQTETTEGGWHSLSPRECLRSRGELGVLWADEPGSLDLAPGVYWRQTEEEVTLWRSDIDRCFGLSGTSARLWRVLMACGDEAVALKLLEKIFNVEETRLREDLRAFVADLLERGLVVRDRR